VGTGIIVGLFLVGAAIGLYNAALHHGTAPTAVSFEVTVSDTAMSPSPLKVRDGDQVVLSISTNRSRTIVLQGYDQTFKLNPGLPVSATFVAAKAGRYDFIDQSSGKKIGELDVSG
jgi:cupredoxin-like protein